MEMSLRVEKEACIITLLRILRANRTYLYLATLLFFLGIAIGFMFRHVFLHMLVPEWHRLQRMAELLKERNNVFLTIWIIFSNNLRIVSAMVVFGVFFMVVPLGMVLVNGIVLGVLFHALSGVSLQWMALVIASGILPHGILEIPAFLIAGAFGIKIGWSWLRPLPGGSRLQSLGHAYREAVPVCLAAIGLLAASAVVEATVTPRVLALTIGHNPIVSLPR
jgi:stage II sporulation protein M